MDILLVDPHWHDLNPRLCGTEQCAPGHFFGPASRSLWILHYVVSGRGRFEARGHSYSLHAGQIFVIRPEETVFYQADRSEPWEYIWIGFDCGMAPPAALERDVIDEPKCGAVFVSALRAREKESGREEFLCQKLWELFALLAEPAPCARIRSEDYVERAKTYLEAAYMRPVSVTALAEQMNLDRSYFSGLFRRHTGLSPQQYLLRLRMNRGAELLAGGLSAAETACSVGYPDEAAFSRMFRRTFGLSPTAYLRRQKSETGNGNPYSVP